MGDSTMKKLEYKPVPEYPADGYWNMTLDNVFEQFGPVHGLTELDRRSVCPPNETIKAEIAVAIMRELGQLATK
jgi:hypothetical protein